MGGGSCPSTYLLIPHTGSISNPANHRLESQISGQFVYFQEEEERLYNNATHPRVAMLKNTNVESEMLARRREYGAAGRRVHYSDR